MQFFLQMDSKNPVKAAGDPEREHKISVDREGGVRYVKNQMMTCEILSKKLKVKPLGTVLKNNC